MRNQHKREGGDKPVDLTDASMLLVESVARGSTMSTQVPRAAVSS